MRKLWRVFLYTLILINIIVPSVQAEPGDLVYVVPISGTIDPGLASFVERAYDEAENSKADYVLLEVDTYGGRIDAAIHIKDRILASPVPSACFVKHKAISAGALITLAGEQIFMASGTTIGAAEPRVGNEKADEKVVSMWTKELVSTA
ncbi:MAG: nodulation protein NfeD, partial [Desulfitobacteriaceae bacterium]|nr:nodulation protein NfeD [Desulfitobacteriaceae bacterium]